MKSCPQCGSSLPESRQFKGCYAPNWAECGACAWPLMRESMVDRLLKSRKDLTTVVVIGESGDGARTLTGIEAQAAVDGLAEESDALVPVCEAAGMVAFRRAGQVEFYLFEGASLQNALAAIAGRQA